MLKSVGIVMTLETAHNSEHHPVLLPEILANLGDIRRKLLIDATYGRGGYARAFLRGGARVIAIDRDPEAIEAAQSLRDEYPHDFTILEGRFGDLSNLLGSALSGAGNTTESGAYAIVFDLGVSSPQLESHERGFSFRYDAPLDMRMEKSGLSAADIVNDSDEAALKAIFRDYGEEPRAGKIARAVVRERPLRTTKQLVDLVERVVPLSSRQRIHPATRTFQALRIAVNDELQQLREGLEAAVGLLAIGGKLIVVSFHSLEDRIVKRFFRSLSSVSRPSRYVPAVDFVPGYRDYGRPICADSGAIAENPRCRSAKLRILEKLSLPKED